MRTNISIIFWAVYIRLLVVPDFKASSLPCRPVHGTSPPRLCEDLTRFSRSQHYGNGPCLVHARFGLLIITYGHPSPGRSAKGRMWKSTRCEKWRAGLKNDPEWRNGSAMKRTHHFLVIWVSQRRVRSRKRVQSSIIFHSVPAVTLEAAEVLVNGEKNASYKNTQYRKFSYNITEKR